MILYVNGDSHTAGAEAVNAHAFAEDDSDFNYLGRRPHPDNLSVTWGQQLATALKYSFACDAESAASNYRIMRTTRDWIQRHPRSLDGLLMVIQWSTWERQEWLIDGEYFQINASGIDHVPDSHRTDYQQFVADVDWPKCQQQAHDEIWKFHRELESQGIRHVFFNGNNWFDLIAPDQQHNWGISYVSPYDQQMTYNQWLIDNNYTTVAPDSWHFGRDAHGAWAKFMLQYIINNQLV